MKKRILSLVLAIAMCFSVVSVFAANDEAVLMGEIGDLIDQYKDRVWEWQENQFGAMTDEQAAAIEAAWTSYEAKKDEVKAIAEQLATDYATDEYIELGLADTANGKDGTLKNLYKWKLMRDIMESADPQEDEIVRVDITSDDADYIDWLARFTAFERENDEKVSPSAPTAALGGLKYYSAELTEFFGELAVLVNNGLVLEGADAAKANLYVEAFNDEQADADYSNPDGFYASLKADIIELATEGMFNAFDLGMQVATNQINKDNTPGLFEMIPDRDMKAAFLILGEEFVRYVVDFIPEVKADLLAMDKNAFVPVVMPSVTPLLGGNNAAVVTAMYNTVAAVADFIAQQDFCEDAVGKVDAYYAADVADGIVDVKDALNKAMTLIDDTHAIELIHYNTFMGRELLRYNNEGEWTKLNGAELDGDALTGIVLGFAHDRYPVVENNLNKASNVASFDANYDADGFKVYAHEDNIGELVFEVAEDADGEATINVYRGYTHYDEDGNYVENLYKEDVYRYVTTFTLKATAAAVDYYVELDDVADTTVDGVITVKGETNLDYVTVAITKPVAGGVKTIYAVVYSKAEFEAGIAIEAPDAAVVGEVYTVVVGTEKASDSDEFTIIDDAADYYVNLDDVADTTADGTITVKGTTNLDYVTVAITKPVAGVVKTVYAVVYSKAEFEAGITINAPDGAVVGEVYTVVVGTEKASDSDEFEIEGAAAPYVDLDEVVNPVVKEDGSSKVVIKGETNLDEVKVTIKDEDGNVVYEGTHTKDELENGIEAEIDGVEPGDNFTVEVTEPGKSDVLDTDEFVAPSLALVGSATRTISKGQSRDIQTTPQGVPAGATAEVVWTLEDGTIIDVTKTSGDAKNFATVKGLKKGTTTLTATLYIDGAATNAAVTVTVKVTTGGGGGGGKVYTNITVKVDETKDVVKVPTGGVNVEFDGTGEGEVKVEIVDGKVVVTGVKEGEVKGTVKVTDENGRTVLTGDYKFTVIKGDEVVKEHECEWPDIAAGWEGKVAPHWAHETIDIMTINGYINGYPDGMFKPDQNITRAEFTAIVYRILGLEIAEDGVLYDDTVGHWAEDIIATMSLPEGYGMTRGYGDGNFGPNDMITREQAVAIIARAKSAVWVEAEEGAKDIFTDAEDISWWFDGEMDAAVANGLITGYEDGSYKPLNFTTRAEACILLARAWPEVLELD